MLNPISIEDAVRKGHFIINPHGLSMWPMIRNGKDSVLIEPVEGRLRKYDIPLYKDRYDRYVLHRIIEVTDTGYVICGDGVFEKEYDITDENILGVMTGFYRKEKFVSCKSKGYMLYSRIWVGLMFMRKPIIVFVRKCRRLKIVMSEYISRIIKGKDHLKK